MQVAVFEQEASSGSLGAQEALEVTMTSDASFMTMMFSNLYSNQVLAAVREPICNAWDAMIDAGKENEFLDISFDRETGDLSIRDYGLGIPKDKIAKIYGVFGGSTKRTDSKTTGGFGLGSKAPWALVDSFRITSRNQGNMSVYNMAKATLESEGKPMIVPMVDVVCPVEDSGLLVQFRVPEANLKQVQDYIQYIVLMGGIKARWNGEEMQTIDMSSEPGSYTIDSKWFNARMYDDHESIFIRYGTVVYPMLHVPGTEKANQLLREFMNILGIDRVLIQAAPSSLGLTPAREALSSGPLTENGLTQLCVDLVAKIEKEIIEDLPKNLAVIESNLYLNRHGKSLEGSWRDLMDKVAWTVFLPEMQRKYFNSKLGNVFSDKWKPRMELAEHVGWKKQVKQLYPKHWSMLNKLRHESKHDWVKFGTLSKDFEHRYYHEMTEMFFDKLWFLPMLKKLHRAGINLKATHFVNGSSYSGDVLSLNQKTGWRQRNIHAQADINNPKYLMETLDFSHISFYSGEFDKYQHSENPVLSSNSNIRKHAFIVKVKASQDISGVIANLTKLGITHTDLRLIHDWDPKVIKAKEKAEKARLALEKARETRRLKREAALAAGLVPSAKPKHKNALGTLRSFLGMTKAAMKSHKPEHTTDTPKLMLEMSEITAQYITPMWRTDWLTEEEKDSIVVVRTGTEAKMAEKRGAKCGKAYFAAKLWAIISEPGYEKYFTKQRQKSLSSQCRFESKFLKSFEALGIKLKGMESLVHIEKYELAVNLFNTLKLKKYLPDVDPETIDSKYHLELDIPLIHKLKKVEKDPMVQGILSYCSYGESMIEVLKQYPERKAALKSIVLAAYNSKDPIDDNA